MPDKMTPVDALIARVRATNRIMRGQDGEADAAKLARIVEVQSVFIEHHFGGGAASLSNEINRIAEGE